MNEAAPPPAEESMWPPFQYWVKVGTGIIGIVVVLRMILLLQGVLLLILASLVLALGLQPPIERLTDRGMRRGVALTIVLAGIGIPVAVVLAMIIPTAVAQTQQVVDVFPEIRAELSELGDFGAFLADRMDLSELMGDEEEVSRTLGAVAATGFNLFTVLVMTPYFAASFPAMKRWLLRLLHREDRQDALELLNESTRKISNYILGNLTISLIAGIIAGVGFGVIGVRSAVILAIWVALTDLIPIAGAFLGAIPAVAVAGLDGLGPAVAVAVFLFAYQLVENFLISPRVMNNAIDLSPATVIIAIMVGSTVAGVLGALLALPLAAMIKLAVEAYVVNPRIDTVRNSERPERNIVGRTRNLP